MFWQEQHFHETIWWETLVRQEVAANHAFGENNLIHSTGDTSYMRLPHLTTSNAPHGLLLYL